MALRKAAALMMMTLTLALSACARHAAAPRDPQLAIELRWVKGYPGETRSKVETGLLWALSFMGASLPVDAPVFSWHRDIVTVDLDAAGVLPATRPAWVAVLNVLKASDEYHRSGAMDIGRFLMLTLCSSHQYFALTGAPRTFSDFEATHKQAWKPAAVVESDIAYGNRLLHISEAATLADIYFVAFEGKGALADHTFQKADIEIIDFMPNGQLRFALFDPAGHPKAAATPELTAAGKPSNCLWCHEINLEPPFRNKTSLPGYYSAEELRALIQERMKIVAAYRSTLKSQIDFRRTGDHTYAELLYLSFAEPSVARLAAEWGLPESEVSARVRGLPTHAQKEAAYLGDHLYERAAVDPLAPYKVLRVPTNIRAASAYEPDLIPQSAYP
jgi:hypothetical protein